MKEELEKLIQRYKKEIDSLKLNNNFKDESKIATICVLREIVQDLEVLLNANK